MIEATLNSIMAQWLQIHRRIENCNGLINNVALGKLPSFWATSFIYRLLHRWKQLHSVKNAWLVFLLQAGVKFCVFDCLFSQITSVSSFERCSHVFQINL
jgi:hypothetical protein